ncbi:tumor protein p63-regulated gene 1 protein isoform X1 [Chiloscyllium plagiosum]|uniref:tumor protein p63-regulated gene 1 protein isoform X1 n=1 Tax=Chiloscyllium plagiosum TaxID=36176 RepID=UPI001CB811B7|nr:tumor protein p63-regulated gene 1 protein isoform X1 [Chiloscyllium plagiosum]
MAAFQDPGHFQAVDLSSETGTGAQQTAGLEQTMLTDDREGAARETEDRLGHQAEKDQASPAPSSPTPLDYKLRKFFVLRPGTFDQALADIKAQINQQEDGTLQSTWLLTEIDHWNNEKERIVLICEKTLLICKYDFMVLTYQYCRRVPLNYIDRIYYGEFSFPERSISRLCPHLWGLPLTRNKAHKCCDCNSRREGKGVRIHWDKLREASFLSRWNPWSTEIPYTTFAEHPAINATERFTSLCQLENFKIQLSQAVQKAYQVDPVPGRANGALILNHPIAIDSYMGVMSVLSNQNRLGYSLARGSVGF